MVKISISDETGGLEGAYKRRLRKIAGTVLKNLGLPSGTELSLSFTNDRIMRGLNREWREIDRSTDVLSFPQGGGPDYTLLGDIVISIDTAKRHSIKYGNTLHDEIKKLIVHGTLHLLGYDHKKKRDKEIMREKESDLMLSIKDL
ncbi:MAG: rRNA maturation RNase YbeY [Candidatus Dadabacteria bacterium]|nr:rRNA maturation RNase YbeY [Candidatus Dadabacteria bacterium]